MLGLKEALPNATRIGFTGTPIETDQKSTSLTLGDYISVYDIARAVEDKATVPIYYESRVVPLEIAGEDLVELAEEQLAAEGEDAARRLIRAEAKLDRVVGAPERLDRVASDLCEHFALRCERLKGKAMGRRK